MPNSKKDAPKQFGSEPRLLAGGNSQIPKGEGDEPVQAYIEAMPGCRRSPGERLDGLVVRAVPDLHKAVKWNQPFYGHEGEGWFRAFRCYTRSTSSSSSSAGPRLIPFRPKRPSTTRCVISTSTKPTDSTRSSSSLG
jgi:hypothetical protein